MPSSKMYAYTPGGEGGRPSIYHFRETDDGEAHAWIPVMDWAAIRRNEVPVLPVQRERWANAARNYAYRAETPLRYTCAAGGHSATSLDLYLLSDDEGRSAMQDSPVYIGRPAPSDIPEGYSLVHPNEAIPWVYAFGPDAERLVEDWLAQHTPGTVFNGTVSENVA